MTLKLGLPSKGRLRDDAVAWFAARGVEVRGASGREYRSALSGVEGVEPVLLAAAEMPRELAAGRLHLTVTGQDLVHEQVPRWEARVAELIPMGFGRADLVVAVPAFWVDVREMSDLDAAAAAFRRAHGHRLRVATKYHNLARGFFRASGVADYQLVDSQGATEGSIKNLAAEAIVDITSTGATLRDNHLRILDDGLILASQATLFASRAAPWEGAAVAAMRALCVRLSIDPPGWLKPV